MVVPRSDGRAFPDLPFLQGRAFVFKKTVFCDGLLELEVTGPFKQAHPTREELLLFAAPKSDLYKIRSSVLERVDKC